MNQLSHFIKNILSFAKKSLMQSSELINSNPYVRSVVWLILLSGILYILFLSFVKMAKKEKYRKAQQKVKMLAESSEETPVSQFLNIRSTKGKNGSYLSSDMDFAGIYILLNKSKMKYYVGQSIHVFERVSQHFSGHGNGDVYADYKYGNNFYVRTIPLKESGFQTLNELERTAISTYHAYYTGYNRNRGNKTK